MTQIDELVKRAREYEYINELDGEISLVLADVRKAASRLGKTMSIPESVIEEAAFPFPLEDMPGLAKQRAKRVILALAEEMPEDAVNEALRVVGITRDALHEQSHWPETMRAAIAAFLKHVAGDSP
jgi:hypothetical protein